MRRLESSYPIGSNVCWNQRKERGERMCQSKGKETKCLLFKASGLWAGFLVRQQFLLPLRHPMLAIKWIWLLVELRRNCSWLLAFLQGVFSVGVRRAVPALQPQNDPHALHATGGLLTGGGKFAGAVACPQRHA